MRKIPQDIAKVKASVEKMKRQTEQKAAPEREFAFSSSLGFQISIELFAGTVMGGAIGYFLDKLFDSKPFLLVTFLLFGAAAGFLNAYRTAKNFEEKNKNV